MLCENYNDQESQQKGSIVVMSYRDRLLLELSQIHRNVYSYTVNDQNIVYLVSLAD